MEISGDDSDFPFRSTWRLFIYLLIYLSGTNLETMCSFREKKKKSGYPQKHFKEFRYPSWGPLESIAVSRSNILFKSSIDS